MSSIKQIITDIPFLKPTTSVWLALNRMEDENVRHLPVVDGSKLLGLVKKQDLDDNTNDEAIVIDFLPLGQTPALHETKHIYDALKMIVEFKISVLPVIDNQNNYLGSITAASILRYFADCGAVTQPGSVIVLSMSPRDYSLANICRIIESENTNVLSSFISSPYNSEQLELTLKLNRQDLSHVITTLERFNFTVQASYEETDYSHFLIERYDSLMNYLNI